MEIFIEIAKPNPGTLKIPSMVEGVRRATLGTLNGLYVS
jgi:hypothetical protein